MKNYRRKKKTYFYIPFNSKGVEEAYQKYGSGRFEIPKGEGFNTFFRKIKENGGFLKGTSIIVNEEQGFLEMSCEQNKADKSWEALEKFLGRSMSNIIERRERRKNVEAFTK